MSMWAWKLREVRDNVTVTTGGRLTAWYLADPQMWSFRSVADGEALIEAQAVQLAELVGRTVHVRVTERPWSVDAWARACWDNSPAPLPAASLVLERDRAMLSESGQAEKLVYYGVSVGSRSVAAQVGKVLPSLGRRDDEALVARLDELDQVMAGPGLECVRAAGDDMAWLLARSFALGCPVPELDVDEQVAWEATDLAEFTGRVDWSAEPLAQSVKVQALVGSEKVVRHVVVLTVGKMSDIRVPEAHVPWVSKTDSLPFPVEWSCRFSVQDPESTGKEMTRLTDRIRAQIRHYRDDHQMEPPRQLERQDERAAEVEDEMRAEFDGLATRTKGWYRIAVAAETEIEVLRRAQQVVDLFKPAIKVHREFDQFRLAREFVPGEPVANAGHERKMPVLKVAAGVPAATVEVGDRRGHLIGFTVGSAVRAVTWDPWFLPEVVESSGLVPLVGGLGAGKSFLAGGIIYKTALAGQPWTVMDPSGRLARLCGLPELRGVSRVVKVLNSEPGTMNPYQLVAEPRPAWFADEPDPDAALARARTAAQAQRRDLTFDTLRWCLPASTGSREDVQTVLRDAILAVPAAMGCSPRDVVGRLELAGSEIALMVARRLREAAERELSRLFFPTPIHLGDVGRAEQHRLVVYSLAGLPQIDERRPVEEWGTAELLTRPLLTLAAWATLRGALERGPHERKGVFLDEMHEIAQVSTGSGLIQKLATDSRKNNIAALVSTQNAARVLGQDVGNFVGAAFVGRTTDAAAQGACCDLMGLPREVGYESTFGTLSSHSRRDTRKGRLREFVFRDGMGGDDGRGGMERIVVDFSVHQDLVEALNTTPDQARLRMVEVA